MTAQYLVFSLSGEDYAVALSAIREIVSLATITRVPCAPPWIRGVTNLRGTVLPVVDLAARFDVVPAPVSKRTALIVFDLQVQGESFLLAVSADLVSRVIEPLPSEIVAPPRFGAVVPAHFLVGLVRSNDRFVHVLDLHRVLSLDEHATVVAATRPSNLEQPRFIEAPAADHQESAGAMLFEDE